MVKKIALEEHFIDPATEPYWRPTMVDVAPQKTAQLYAALTDFGEQRLQMMDKTGIARAVLAIAGPGVQVEPDTATAMRNAPCVERFSRQGSSKTSRPLFRLRASCHAGPEGRRRRVGTLRARSQILRRHDRWPHQRQISRRPFLRSVLGARGRARRADLPAPRRSGGAIVGDRRLQCVGATDVGLGRRDRLARAAYHLRRGLPSLSEGQAGARPSRRDVAVPTLAFRQPFGALWLEFAEAAVAISQRERLGDDLGHVRSAAGALLGRCAWTRPRHVLGRLPVRLARLRIPGHGADRGILARRYCLQQRGEAAETSSISPSAGAPAYHRARRGCLRPRPCKARGSSAR